MEIPSYHRADAGGREPKLSPALGALRVRWALCAQPALVCSLLLSAAVHALLAPAHLYPAESHAHGADAVGAAGPEILGFLFIAAAVSAFGLAVWLSLSLNRLTLIAASALLLSLLVAYPLVHFGSGEAGPVSGLDIAVKLAEAVGLGAALLLLRAQTSWPSYSEPQ